MRGGREGLYQAARGLRRKLPSGGSVRLQLLMLRLLQRLSELVWLRMLLRVSAASWKRWLQRSLWLHQPLSLLAWPSVRSL